MQEEKPSTDKSQPEKERILDFMKPMKHGCNSIVCFRELCSKNPGRHMFTQTDQPST